MLKWVCRFLLVDLAVYVIRGIISWTKYTGRLNIVRFVTGGQLKSPSLHPVGTK